MSGANLACGVTGSAPVRLPKWPRHRRVASPRQAGPLPQRKARLGAQRQPRSSLAPQQPRPPRHARTTAHAVACRVLVQLRAQEAGDRGRSRRHPAGACRAGGACCCKSPRAACEGTDGRTRKLKTRLGVPADAHLCTAKQARQRLAQALRLQCCSSCDSIVSHRPVAGVPSAVRNAPREARWSGERPPRSLRARQVSRTVVIGELRRT